MQSSPQFPSSGERREGVIESELPLLRGWSWPYIAITGNQDGPLVTITAGVHGCEYVSIRGAMQLARKLDPALVHGRLLVVPVVNQPAYWERTPFLCPYDGKNPNRVFPGMASGTFSEAMAHFIFHRVVAPSDAYIDLHGGDLVEALYPFSLYPTGGSDEVVARSRAMAEAFGLPYTVAHGADGLAMSAAAQVGIPSMIAEAGSSGLLTDEEVELILQGCLRALTVAGTLEGDAEAPPTRVLEHFEAVTADQPGFWAGIVRTGEAVSAGDLLGSIVSLTGEQLCDVRSPRTGIVLSLTTSPAVKEGGALVVLGA